MLPAALQFLIAMIACAINERLQRKLDYTQEEVRVLKEVVRAISGTGRIAFTAEQPDHVANILAEAGIEPAPERAKKRTWKQFIKMHWESLYACDFFSVEVLGISGTVRYMVFFVIEIKTRAVEIAGIEVDPGGEWMKQVARNLTDPVDGFLRGATHLIHDRDPLFTEAFTTILRTGSVTCVKIPAQSPNCNPHAERFVKTIKYECLNAFIFFGERHLRYVVKEFMAHYLAERFHQGLGGQLIKAQAGSANDNGTNGAIMRRSRLGSFLNYYHREAA